MTHSLTHKWKIQHNLIQYSLSLQTCKHSVKEFQPDKEIKLELSIQTNKITESTSTNSQTVTLHETQNKTKPNRKPEVSGKGRGYIWLIFEQKDSLTSASEFNPFPDSTDKCNVSNCPFSRIPWRRYDMQWICKIKNTCLKIFAESWQLFWFDKTAFRSIRINTFI